MIPRPSHGIPTFTRQELTESFGCFNASRTHLSDLFSPDCTDVLVVVVGDGITPRIAAVFFGDIKTFFISC